MDAVCTNLLPTPYRQTFEWPLQVALSATEVIQIEVFDHEKLKKLVRLEKLVNTR